MRARRRYRLILALLGGAALLGSVTLLPPDPAPAAPPDDATPVRVTRLELGGFDAPGPGVGTTTVPPSGGVLGERAEAGSRTLVLRRVDVPPFSAVGVTWAAQPRPAEVSVLVRVRRDRAWTPWRAAAEAESGRDETEAGSRDADLPGTDRRRLRDGAELQWWGPADGVEVAVSTVAGPPPTGVAVDLIDPGRRPADAGAQADRTDIGPPGARADTGAPVDRAEAARADGPYLTPRVPRPSVARRAAWGADERKMGWTPEYLPYVKAGTIHHTATGNGYSAADVPGLLRSIYHFHAVSRGWGDIGYNVLVDRFGRLWEGRAGGLSRAVIGAHSGGYNSYTTGVAFIGDHRTARIPARSQESAARFLAWKFSLSPAFDPTGTTTLTGGGFGSRFRPGTTISVFRIHGHRRTNATTCPGAQGMAALGPLRRRTAALLGVWTDPARLRARLTVWRPDTASWYVRGVAAPVLRGAVGDLPVPADYDGDGTSDLATWRPRTGGWTIWYSSTRRTGTLVLGQRRHRPVPADTNGDGRAEPWTYDPVSGRWHNTGTVAPRWGLPGDVPVPGDYTGDGRADLAVWRPGEGGWLVRGAGRIANLGVPGETPVPADFDGDGALEPATWSKARGRLRVDSGEPKTLGRRGAVAVPGQYDGDAPAEVAVWDVSAGRGRWRIDDIGTYLIGTDGDQPIPAS